MARGKYHEGDEEVKLSITPLIDVAFLLLIFFMSAMKFKTLERKVAAFLPKDRGLAKTKIKLEEKPKITVELKRTKGEKHTRVKLLDSEIGIDEVGFSELRRRIAGIKKQSDELPGEINAWAEVPHSDVVKAIDAFMAAEITDITFVGAPPKGHRQSGSGDPNAR